MLVSKNDPHQGMNITSVVNKDIMSQIRGGDYQHPGEEDAIEILFSEIEKKKESLFLDVGCGYGGSARYLFRKKWGKVIGIDINKDVVQIAKEKTCGSRESNLAPMFLTADVLDIDNVLRDSFSHTLIFDVIYSMSSFFLLPEQQLTLTKLADVSRAGTKLLIFDYVNYKNYNPNSYLENGISLLPNVIHFEAIEDLFNASCWDVSSIKKIDGHFVLWYTELLSKIERNEAAIIEQYCKNTFDCFIKRYRHILNNLISGVLGGVIISACLC